MHDALAVCGGETASDLRAVLEGLTNSEGTVVQKLAQTLTLEEFGNNVRSAAFLSNLKNGENVRMIESGGGLSFVGETTEAIAVLAERRRKYLDSYFTMKRNITRAIDL